MVMVNRLKVRPNQAEGSNRGLKVRQEQMVEFPSLEAKYTRGQAHLEVDHLFLSNLQPTIRTFSLIRSNLQPIYHQCNISGSKREEWTDFRATSEQSA